MATPTSNGNVSNVTLSGWHHIDSLIDGKKWGGSTGTGVNLTYSFGEWGSSYYKTNYHDNMPFSNFGTLTSIQRTAAKNALAAWSEIANINFTQVIDSKTVAGDIRFAKSSNTGTASAYTPGAFTEAGDVWFSHSDNYNTATKGTYGYLTFLHEIGHALGLKHPHESGIGGVANTNIDTTAYSVMSYRSYVGQPVYDGYAQSFFPTTLMLNDIAAIQHLYGANMTTRSGNTVYQWGSGQQLLETIWDAGGNDTIDWSNQSTNATINLNAGQWSQLGPAYWNGVAWENKTLAIAYNVTIENATGGSGNDTITGNTADNVLKGGFGNDYLYGGFGNDYLYGEAGNDTLSGGYGNDYLSGGDGNDYLYDDVGNDTLSGGNGNDYLNGGTGNDWMYGGTGNDSYSVDSSGDIVTEYLNEGTDTVYSSISYSLGNNLENLSLTGSAYYGYGNSLNNSISGNDYNNYLWSGDGNDSLYGYGGYDILIAGNGNDYLNGGTGNDSMYGGAGDDTYIVDSTSDFVAEYLNEGTDIVYSYASYSLGNNIENLSLTSSAYYGYGNSLNNTISGNSYNNYLWSGDGNDTLYGYGGNDYLDGSTGNDLMYGGTGDDTFVVDNSSDVVTESLNEGTDTVSSSISYSLGNNLENLTLTGTAYSGYGNTLNNTISGNNYNNYLSGGDGNDTLIGNAGNDTLVGGFGNDILTGGADADKFVFNSRYEGIDTITDFAWQQGDKLLVSASGFSGGLNLGALLSSQFIIGSGASDTSDRFIYNSSTGGLFFDADGIGASSQVQFAKLSTGLNLISSDIVVV